MVVLPRHPLTQPSRDAPTSPRLPRLDTLSVKASTSPHNVNSPQTARVTVSYIHSSSVVMDVPTGSPVEGLQGLRKFLPNPAILVSRPSSSSPSLSMLPDSPSKLGVVRSEGVDAMTQSFGDVGGLAAAGLVAQAVDQEVLEQEIAVKVYLHENTEKTILKTKLN